MRFRRLLAGAMTGAIGWAGATGPVHAAPDRGVPGSAREARASRPAAADPSRVELIIPKLHVDDPVGEGVSESDLWHGVGHYPGTADPGQVGNAVFLGHRTSGAAPFSELERMRAGDAVILVVGRTRYTYRVTGTRITEPNDLSVLAPVPMEPGRRATGAWATLVTCHPRGSDRQRFVVFARLTH
ncbi:class E sortase [Actinomadura gamaensis]|uniref:Class E sortase n=1 Tax=Actinomadura gamaensis TaxID=1763541 RepID=A0ABV9U1Q0_9ACTN